jgi:hypothetical protein
LYSREQKATVPRPTKVARFAKPLLYTQANPSCMSRHQGEVTRSTIYYQINRDSQLILPTRLVLPANMARGGFHFRRRGAGSSRGSRRGVSGGSSGSSRASTAVLLAGNTRGSRRKNLPFANRPRVATTAARGSRRITSASSSNRVLSTPTPQSGHDASQDDTMPAPKRGRFLRDTQHSAPRTFESSTAPSEREQSLHTAVDTEESGRNADAENSDDLNEIVMAVDIRERMTGCCYYIARQEKLCFMEDMQLGGPEMIDTCKCSEQRIPYVL